jgi:hypothetical protein
MLIFSPYSDVIFLMCSCYSQEISNREKEGQLDESFLSEVNAQLRQVSDTIYYFAVPNSADFG